MFRECYVDAHDASFYLRCSLFTYYRECGYSHLLTSVCVLYMFLNLHLPKNVKRTLKMAKDLEISHISLQLLRLSHTFNLVT